MLDIIQKKKSEFKNETSYGFENNIHLFRFSYSGRVRRTTCDVTDGRATGGGHQHAKVVPQLPRYREPPLSDGLPAGILFSLVRQPASSTLPTVVDIGLYSRARYYIIRLR